MNKINTYNQKLSQLVDYVIQKKGYTLQKCCDIFNTKYAKDISMKAIKPLDKDFVQRLRSNKFKIVSPRIVKFCEFIGINTDDYLVSKSTLGFEIHLIEELIKNNPTHEKEVKALLKNIAKLLV